jgi:AcrR family transcriptional regulator
MPVQDTRDKICEAAIRTASRDGLLSMTLDNVAREAGVSKGGVMYHFPSKDELVRGMLEYFGAQVEQMILRRVAIDPEPRFRWARNMVACLFPKPGDRAHPEEPFSPEVLDRFMLTVIAAVVNSPAMIEPMRQVGRRLRERLLADPNDGLDQLLICLAMDGLFLWQFVGLIRRDEPLYAEIGEALREKVTSIPRMTIPAAEG